MAIKFITGFSGRYRQQADFAGLWEPATLTRWREPASPANLHADQWSRRRWKHGGARMERDRESHVSVTTWQQWLLYLQLAFPADIGSEPSSVCSGSMVHGYYFGLWTRRSRVRVLSGCQYSMRLDRLHRAYPNLHPFGVVHWVPVLSNIKTATGCESNRQLQLELCLQGRLCITTNPTVFKDGLGTYIK